MFGPDPRAPKLPPGFDANPLLFSFSDTGSKSHKALMNRLDRLAAAGETVQLAKLFVQQTRVDKRPVARTDRKVYRLIRHTAGVEGPKGFPMFKVDVLHAIRLRWFLAHVADCMVLAYRLPVPMGVRCLMWDMEWWQAMTLTSGKIPDYGVRLDRIEQRFWDKGGLHPHVESLQGSRFQRFGTGSAQRVQQHLPPWQS